MLVLTDRQLAEMKQELQDLSHTYADRPMSPEREAAYLKALLSAPGLEHIDQLMIAFAKIGHTWEGAYIPFPGNILALMPRRHTVVL